MRGAERGPERLSAKAWTCQIGAAYFMHTKCTDVMQSVHLVFVYSVPTTLPGPSYGRIQPSI